MATRTPPSMPRGYRSPMSFSAPRTAHRSLAPGWQATAENGRPRGRIIRHVPGTPIDPQEGDIIYEEPDFARAAIASPGGRTKTVAVRQNGPSFSGELIAPGQPTPAAGSQTLIEGEGNEGPVIEESIMEGGSFEGDDGDIVYEGDGMDPGVDGACAGCDPCNYSQWGPHYSPDVPHRVVPCDGFCIPRNWIDETALFLGVQGFTNPLDVGRNGNFGYHEGVNFAGHFGRLLGIGSWGLGYQVGATFMQSDLNGNLVNGVQDKNRDQQFFTAGVFRRAHDGYGLQGGFVYDYMHDNFYTKYSVGQIRVEVSYLTYYGHEVGFWGAFSIHDGHDLLNGIRVGYQTINMFNGFYRYTFSNGAQGRVWFGGTDSKQGIIGSDFRLPLSNRWDLWGWYNYLLPGNQGLSGATQQAWNLSMNVVWYPGRKACGTHHTPFRALFAPADNNWLITRPSAM